jgi:hypothetical protein
MKKLTLLIAMLMATSAWAETKTLECEYSWENDEGTVTTYKNTYTFDPEMPNGEYLSSSGEVKPVEVAVFPNYYRLTRNHISRNGTTVLVGYMIDISRLDLSSTIKTEWFLTNNTTNTAGQCKFIESAKKLF